LRVALLPPGHDPDTLLRTAGPAAFAECIAASRSLLAYALDRALAETGDASGPRGRATAFARVAMMLAKVTNSEEALALAREAALRARPEAAAEALMPDLPGDVERGVLAALLLDERDQMDAATELAQFQNRFELKRRLQRLREATRAIAEGQAAGGASIEGVQT